MPPRMPNTDWMKSGGWGKAAVEEVSRRVAMADVVAFDFEPRLVAVAGFEDMGDVAEGVLEDAVVAACQVGQLPVLLPGPVTWNHLVEAEVHRAHVQGRDLWLEEKGRLQAFLYDIVAAPPVVRLITTSVAALIRGRNSRNTAGS